MRVGLALDLTPVFFLLACQYALPSYPSSRSDVLKREVELEGTREGGANPQASNQKEVPLLGGGLISRKNLTIFYTLNPSLKAAITAPTLGPVIG